MGVLCFIETEGFFCKVLVGLIGGYMNFAYRFSIPFNRQELADFLAVDRSAMSAELCRLRDEGVLEFCKNRFRLL